MVPSKNKPQEISVEVDVCVVGGGIAGLCAALAAARHGARTALVHDRSVLGGNASSEIRMHICGASHARNHVWRETGIIEELRLKGMQFNSGHNTALQDLAFYDVMRSQPGLQGFLNSHVMNVETDGRTVQSCTAVELTSGRRIKLSAAYFVDATGDGMLAYLAGASFRQGREGRAEFGESLAPEIGDSCTMGHTVLFQAKIAKSPSTFTAPVWAEHLSDDKELLHRPHSPGQTFGHWWLEAGGTRDTVWDTEAIKDDMLAATVGMWDHLKNSGDHGLQDYDLNWLGFLAGKRESRRFVGDYVLTQQDIEQNRSFPDAIAYGGWPIDIHPPEGYRSSEPAAIQFPVNPPYMIPLRSCYCRDFDNLFLAGRDISATHVAFASTRVMATCGLIGEGVGVAAATGVRHGAPSAAVIAQTYMQEVQQLLLRDGTYLPGWRNADPSDIAREATVTASSEAEGCPAVSVIDGINHPEPGNPHAWRSNPAQGLPAWIQLTWPAPQQVQELQIIFDTDFENTLMLTQAKHYQTEVNTAPRKVTVRNFRVLGQRPGTEDWIELFAVRDNDQRLWRKRCDPVDCRAVRVVIEDTWGASFASVFEIRGYSENKSLKGRWNDR